MPREGQLATQTFHTETRLADGRPSVLIDPGSLGNLTGDQWAREAAKTALETGGPTRKPQEYRRQRPLTVSGVGKGSQQASHNVRIPYACKTLSGGRYAQGVFEAPCVPESQLPALLGLASMKKQRTVLDLVNNQMHFCGPGEITLNLPPGTESFQLEEAPSGHLVLPICEYDDADSAEDKGDIQPRANVLLSTTSDLPTVSTSSASTSH